MIEEGGQTVLLRKNSIGLTHIVFFVVAAAAPLTAVVGATPAAIASGNGPGVPGAFILSGALYLLFSVGFAAMSRFAGGAGAFYTYITKGLNKPLGVAGAFIAILTYYAVQIAIYALFAFFAHAALLPLGIDVPWWVLSVAAIGLVTACGRRNVAFSGNLLGVCMIAEIAILLVLDFAIVAHGGGPEGMSLSAISPSLVFVPGLGTSLVFVIGSYIGFEATAIFAEEARDPERTIPRATYVAVLLITVFYTFSTWAIVQYYGPSTVVAAAKANPDTFYFGPAAALVGQWASQTMNLLLITSLFACVLSFHNTINRYFFAIGREGLAWRGLGRIHPRHSSPATAGLVQSIGALLVILAFAVSRQDPYAVVFSWMAALAVLGILVVQFFVCLAIVAFFHKESHGVSVWKRLIAPIGSAAGLAAAFALVVANLPLLSGSDSILVMSFPYLIALVGCAGLVLALWLRRSRPALYASLGEIFEG